MTILLYIVLAIIKIYTVKGECQDINPTQTRITSGVCANTPEGVRVREGSQCEIRCKSSCRFKDSRESDRRTIQCLRNQWDTDVDAIRCIPTQPCDTLQQLQGLVISCSNSVNFDSVCNFNCANGFIRGNGLTSISCSVSNVINDVCSKPSWSAPFNQLLTCNQNRCPDLTINGQTYGVCIGAVQAQQCTLQCNTGTLLNLNNAQQLTLTCGVTQWQPFFSQIPQCLDTTCSNLVPPVNGGFMPGSSCSPGIIGRLCSFQCNAGFELNGNNNLLCQSDGSWSTGGRVPTCVAPQPQSICPELPINITNGRIANLTGCVTREIGAICIYSCDLNYRILGDSQRFCQQSGQWNPSNTPPTCVIINCNQPRGPLENGQQSANCNPGISGQTCNYVCNSGYGITGTSVYTCQPNGVWSPIPATEPVCTKIYCPTVKPADNVANYSDKCETAEPDDTCDITCNTGDVHTITCESTGKWSDTFTCEPTVCRYLPAPDNGFNDGVCKGQLTGGEVCKFGCNDTNSILLPRNASIVTCNVTTNGWDNYDWNNVPKCERYQPCPSFGPPMYGNTTGTCLPPKPFESCNFTCNTGYLLSGNDSMTCSMNGSWTPPGIPPTCSQIVCPDVKVTGALRIYSGSCKPGLVGKDCTFSCARGLRLIGKKSITCNNDGTWSDVQPTCPTKPGPTKYPRIKCSQKSLILINCAQNRCVVSKNCRPGFQSSKSTRICMPNGNWSGREPQCLRQCTKLRNTNARLSGKCSPNGVQGSSCSVICNSGFRRTGPQTVTCQASGYWSALPQCRRNTRTGNNGRQIVNRRIIIG